MITELSSQEKVIGVKQSRKAIREGRAKQVYLPVEQSHTMAQLGQACRITVGAAVVAVL